MSEQEDRGDCVGTEFVAPAAPDWHAIYERLKEQQLALLGMRVLPLPANCTAPAFITGDWSVEYPPIAEHLDGGSVLVTPKDVFPLNAMRAWSV